MKDTFIQCLADSQILHSENDLEYYGKDVCQHYQAMPSAILLPTSVEEVVACINVAKEKKISLVPSAGRTGYSGGATATQGEVILSLSKLNKILDINTVDRTMKVQAGVPLEVVQNYAKEHGLMYPVDFTSRGSCLIGGTIATNAGGVRVIRYGLTRDWIVGLKVVTASGEVLELNGSLIKNQTGYDLRQLFIGSEGTLGVIVEATLKLTSPANNTRLAFCAFSKTEDALPTLVKLREAGLVIELFEYLEESGLELVLKHHNLQRPFAQKHSCYALIEIDAGRNNAQETFEQTLSALIEQNIISDVAISESIKQYNDLMALRELIGETANQHYTVHKNDISVKTSDIPQFISQLKTLLASYFSKQKVLGESVVFGHLGDGNLHVNILMSKDLNKEKFWELCTELDKQIFNLVKEFKGSISAEHGVGLLKKAYLHYSRSSQEIEFMKKMKSALDPDNILNPGKIF